MTDTILPHALPKALDGRDGIKLLSLDCFDTLLWRDTHAPRDVFGLLPGVTVLQRMWAEERARIGAKARHRRGEVHIDEIYRELFTANSTEQNAAAIQAELDAEAQHCFAFRPTVELMREAKRRGLQVIIVSDTYLDAEQLRELIATAAGDEVAGLIDKVFASSRYGKAKADGLYEHILKELKGIAPREILHIGDNEKADVGGVAPFGVQTIHLKQFTEATEQRLRLESSVSSVLHPVVPGTAITPQPHRAALASGEPRIGDAAETFGFTALGPVFHGFDRWLVHEADELAARNGGKVHWLFLMRDGYLPMQMHRGATGDDNAGHAVEISRFTATAASLSSEKAIIRLLELDGDTNLPATAKQLLLPPAEIAMIMKNVPTGKDAAAFRRQIQTPQRIRRIIKNSQAFAERLVAHVRTTVNPAKGDTLMLVDLGYNGSVQNQIDALLRDAFGVHVAGRYLLLREQFVSGLDKRGLVGHDQYDATALEALCGNVAVYEQLATVAQGSVIDYQPDGTPIRRNNSIKGGQSAVRSRVQAGCVAFARENRDIILRNSVPDAATMWRRAAAAAMTRLMFLPLPQELAVIGEFEHDVNLGGDGTVALFDAEIARRGLRQRGLFYMKGSERMYLPAELQGEGMATKLALFTQRRFGMPLKNADFADHSIALPVLAADGVNVHSGKVTATPTHDGYYMAPIPIEDCRYSIGLQFGQLFDWVQIESISFMSVKRFLSDKQRGGGEVDATPSLEGMEMAAQHLFRCTDEHAFMMVPSPPRNSDEPMMLAVVFRPIAARASKRAPSANAILAGVSA